MSHAPPGVEKRFPSPKRQARKGPGGDLSIDEVSSGSGGRRLLRAPEGPKLVRSDDGKAALAPGNQDQLWRAIVCACGQLRHRRRRPRLIHGGGGDIEDTGLEARVGLERARVVQHRIGSLG